MGNDKSQAQPTGGRPAGRKAGKARKIGGDEFHGDKVAGSKIQVGSVLSTDEGQVNIAGGDIITSETTYDVVGLPNPYLGLRSFTYADHLAYAGRKDLVDETTVKLTAPHQPQGFLFITGASGSGKSSFAQAGLLPALEGYYQARHMSVQHAVFRPSHDPLAGLADALQQLGLAGANAKTLAAFAPGEFAAWLQAHVPAGQVNLLVIDQFEESFTQSPPEKRQRLLDIDQHGIFVPLCTRNVFLKCYSPHVDKAMLAFAKAVAVLSVLSGISTK